MPYAQKPTPNLKGPTPMPPTASPPAEQVPGPGGNQKRCQWIVVLEELPHIVSSGDPQKLFLGVPKTIFGGVPKKIWGDFLGRPKNFLGLCRKDFKNQVPGVDEEGKATTQL